MGGRIFSPSRAPHHPKKEIEDGRGKGAPRLSGILLTAGEMGRPPAAVLPAGPETAPRQDLPCGLHGRNTGNQTERAESPAAGKAAGGLRPHRPGNAENRKSR